MEKMCKNSKSILRNLLNSFPETQDAKRESNNLNSSEARPFLQWVGGKRNMIQQYKKYFPADYNTYYEPFVGGGAVFFSLLPSNAIITDSNQELIETYKAIRDSPEEVISLLEELKKKHSKELYMAIRELDRIYDLFFEFSLVEIASRMIYLNQTCFNAVYRVNKKSQFNVPIGSSLNRLICDKNAIIIASKILKKAKIICADFEEALLGHNENDFIYLDPPYEPVSKYSDFTRYTKEKFYQDDQLRLKNIFDKLTKAGCKVMLSNSDCEYIRDLYKEYNIIYVTSLRTLNCKKDRRGQVSELLITNY